MIRTIRLTTAALAASVVLASCSGGGSSNTVNVVPPPGNPGSVAPVQKLSITGVGDSLTAGVQSSGLMGADVRVRSGRSRVSVRSRPPFLQATQEHGFFALLWEQANGVGIGTMSDPTKSPLPLMTPLGIGGMLAPTSSKIFPVPLTNYCDAHQIPANQFNTALSLRENPALNPWDVGIPGQTMHEALFMTGAIGDCTVNGANSPATFVALNSLVNGESQNFWPILAGFGQGVTQVDAAASLHAQVATVWLGSNDLLKVAFSRRSRSGHGAAVDARRHRGDHPQASSRGLESRDRQPGRRDERVDVHPAARVPADAAGVHRRRA